MLLLDEPAAGVPEAERRDILDAIAALPADVSVLLIEHDMDLVFSFARRISVLVDGACWSRASPTRSRAIRACAPSISARAAMADLLAIERLSAPAMAAPSCCRTSAFRLGEGEALAVLGRNGVGKTTLIDSIVGVTRRFAGSMRLAGRELGNAGARRRGRRWASAGCRRSATSSAR